MTSLRSTRGLWLAYLLVGAGATALYHLWPAFGVQTVVALGLTGGALAALVAGIRLHRPGRQLAWRGLLVGQAAAFGSWLLWQYAIAVHGAAPAPGSVEDLFWITNSLALVAAMVLLRHAHSSRGATLVDSAIVGSALAILTWIFLFGPALESSTGSALAAQATYASLDVAMMAILAPLAFQRGVRTPAGTMLLLGTVAVLATDLLFTWSTATGATILGAWNDAGWLLSPVLIGAAALHPSMARLYDRRPRREEGPSTPYLVVLAAALLAVPALVAVDVLGAREIHTPLVPALATLLSLLVLKRLVGLVRQGEALRRDLAAQNRALRERTAAVEILREVAEAADSSTSTDEALARAIDVICDAIGWPVGHAYVKERGFPQLAPTQIWHLDDPIRWAPFVDLTQSLHFVAGHGLPGRVLASGEPEWLVARADDGTHPRAPLADELGLRSAFALPVLLKGEVAAVLEFFSTAAIEPDPWLTELSRAVGSQLARVLERREAEATLRASEARFRGVVANVPGAIYRISTDRGLRIVHFLSDDIAAITGYPAADFVEGRITAQDVIHPDDQAAMDQTMADAIAAERDFSLEYRMLHADGSLRWVSETGRPVHDEATDETWFDGLIIDVTERKEAERLLREAEDRYRTLVEELPMITYADTPAAGESGVWHPHYVSSQLESLLGWTQAEWFSDPDFYFDRVVHPDDRAWVRAEHELAYRETTGHALEHRLLHRDGTTRWFLDRMVIVRDEDGAPRWSQGYLQDITERKEAEERLAQTERRYRTLVEQLPLATYVDSMDGDGSTYVSPQIGELVGYAPEEWLADPKLFSKLLHPEDRERVLAEIRRATTANEPILQEYRVVARDGRTVWLRDSAVVVRDEAGTPLYRQGYAVDVTAQKHVEAQLREAEERYRTLVEQLPLAVYADALDEVSSALYMSPQIEAMLGYPVQQWLDDREFFPKVLHPEDRERVLARVGETARTGESFCEEYRLIASDGRVVWIRDEDVTVVDADGTPLYSQGYMLDITERKQAEDDLERQNEELRTLDRLKDEFIALVSHELRTPLTSIRGYLELVLEGTSGSLSDEQEQFLGVVQRNADRLQSLVGDLLFVAQLEAGRLDLEQEPVDLAALAEESVETGRPLAAAKGVELSLALEPMHLLGDRGRLGQLLDNFVSNAIKFTPEGGTVEVRLSSREGSALLEVSDTGMGIPADEQDRLFERFFRSSTATAQAIQGTGLGLTISKAIVEAHGGRITFTSVENEGTTFRIELPLEAALSEAA